MYEQLGKGCSHSTSRKIQGVHEILIGPVTRWSISKGNERGPNCPEGPWTRKNATFGDHVLRSNGNQLINQTTNSRSLS